MSVVLDASALLAWLQGEPGAQRVDDALQGQAVIHTVNLAEVLTKLSSRGAVPAEVYLQLTERGILGKLLTVEAGREEDAQAVAALYNVTRRAGLSLGDRYCLNLGRQLHATVLTTDRAWNTVDVGVKVELLR